MSATIDEVIDAIASLGAVEIQATKETNRGTGNISKILLDSRSRGHRLHPRITGNPMNLYSPEEIREALSVDYDRLNALDWDDPNRHHALVTDLCNRFDCWAMSLSSPSLKVILPMCPDDCRVMALFPGTGVMAREWERFKRFEDAKQANTLFAMEQA